MSMYEQITPFISTVSVRSLAQKWVKIASNVDTSSSTEARGRRISMLCQEVDVAPEFKILDLLFLTFFKAWLGSPSVFNDSRTDEGINVGEDLYKLPQGCWALSYAGAITNSICEMFLSSRGVPIIHTTSPNQRTWKEWLKQRGGVVIAMDVWGQPELEALLFVVVLSLH